MFGNFSGFITRLSSDRRGTTLLAFGLVFVPVVLSLGVAVDLGRAAILRSSLQAAADSGVLAAGVQPKLTQAKRENIARNTVMANLGEKARNASIIVTETEPAAGVYQVSVKAEIPTAIMRVAKFDTMSLNVSAEARNIGGSSNPIEIALALDNTGSMRNDMPALKAAAKSLVQSVMSDGANGQVRVSVVPYVAAVNPGITDTSMIDTRAVAPTAGNWFNWAWLGYDSGCTPVWGSGGSGPGGSNSGDSEDSGDASDLINLLDPFRRVAQQLFGVSAALAADVTPNTVPTLTLQNYRSTSTSKTYRAPVGFNIQSKGSGTAGCDWIVNPGLVSTYELFNRLIDDKGSKVAWKGCVEARATSQEITSFNNSWGRSYTTGVDYDVVDTAPSAADPASLFVPYFWPDEPDYSTTTGATLTAGRYVAGSGGFHNNYMTDYTVPNGWGWVRNDWNNGQNILKYDGVTRSAIIREQAPETYGPNASCPEPVTRLTNNQTNVISAIERMNFWNNGGTIISEGLMWAWRSLSPDKPYADGKPYEDAKAKKVIVLMTDGVNGLADNGNSGGAGLSDYSAYGYLGASRLYWADNVTTYASLQTFLDNRTKKACDNAKAKGIHIYTVMFNHSGFLSAGEQTHSADLLKYCASKPEYAYLATDSTALDTAFQQIAASAAATPLHLTR